MKFCEKLVTTDWKKLNEVATGFGHFKASWLLPCWFSCAYLDKKRTTRLASSSGKV